MQDLLNNPLFGVVLTLGAFEIGKLIFSKTKMALFNPLLIAIGLIITILLKLDISLETYNHGGNIIVFLLGPATVTLAIPLYKQSELFKKHFIPILLGIIIGAITAISSVIVMGKMLKLDMDLLLSFVPKSITTPIGIEVSRSIGGEPSITIMGIILTGITGYIVAPKVCKIFKIKNEIAVGIGIGAASHAIGTSKALEMGEVSGAMGSLAIGVTGIITLILAPIMVQLFL